MLYFSPSELPAERGGAVYPHDRGGGAAARLLAGADHHAGGQRDQPRQHRDHEGEHAAGPRLRLPGRGAQVVSRYSLRSRYAAKLDIGYLRGFIYQVSGGGRKRDLDRDRARDAEGRDEQPGAPRRHPRPQQLAGVHQGQL